MLSKLFKRKSRLEDTDPAVRSEAIEALADDAQDVFERFARDDDNLDVRRAALARMSNRDAIAPLLEVEGLCDVAAQSIALLPASDEESTADNHPRVLICRIALSEDSDQVIALAGKLNEPKLVAAALRKINAASVRFAVVEKIWDEATLVEIEREMKGHDKSVNRLVRGRLHDAKDLKALVTERKNRASTLTELSKKHRPGDRHFEAKRVAMDKEWRTIINDLTAANTELERFGFEQTDIRGLERHFTVAPAIAPVKAPAKPKIDRPRPEAESLETFEQQLDTLAKITTRLTDDPDSVSSTAEIHNELTDIQTRWSKHADVEAPPDNQALAFRDHCHTAQEALAALQRAEPHKANALEIVDPSVDLVDPTDESSYQAFWRAQANALRTERHLGSLIAAIRWPSQLAAPQWVTRLIPRRDALHPFIERYQKILEALQDQIEAELDSLDRTIDSGEVKEATTRLNKVTSLVHSLPHSAPKDASSKLAGRAARLRELHDWQTFAERPKREALCEEIEKLAASPLQAADQFERIKALRSAWNELAHATSSGDRSLMDRFNAAAEKAFETCRTHFAEQAEQRQFNLQAREKICDELQKFLDSNDWDHADYIGVDRILRAARNEWRNYHPVDRSSGRKVETRFKTLTEQIHAYLQAAWDNNVAAKEAIVAEAQEATASDASNAELIVLMKTLQQRWKSVGPTPRRADQHLWKSFRTVCDNVFAAREEGRENQKSMVQDAIGDADRIVEDMKVRLEAGPDKGAIREARQHLDALDNLPSEAERHARRVISDVEQTISLQLLQKQHEDRLVWLANVDKLDAHLAQIERDHVSLADASDDNSLGGWRSEADSLTQLFDTRLARLGKDPCNLDRLRRLAIEAEIMAEIDSPTDDKPLRLEIQVEALNQGMTARDRKHATPEALVRYWCAEATNQTGADPLRERFFNATRRVLER